MPHALVYISGDLIHGLIYGLSWKMSCALETNVYAVFGWCSLYMSVRSVRIGKRSPKWQWLKDKEGQRKVRGPE